MNLVNCRMKKLFAIVDIETTGGAAANSGITEVAIFIHDGEKIIEEYVTLINPRRAIPTYITALTGINNAMVASAPGFEEVADKIYELLKDKVFIAHNVNFDFSFIKEHLSKAGIKFLVPKLCTVRLSRKAFPGFTSYSLGTLCRQLDIGLENRHRARGDAAATVLLFEKIIKEQPLVVEEMLKKNLAAQWLPVHLEQSLIKNLPASPGVYYFHDAKQKIIYVGKAVNIKKRVTSHFTGHDPAQRRQDFLRLVTDISYKECSNELHALVLESTEIKRLWPKYNYSQKEPSQKYALYDYIDHKGFRRILLDKKKKNLPAICTFNLKIDGWSFMQKLIERFNLNAKLCFIDSNPLTQEDFAVLGAAETYNIKVAEALTAIETELPTFAIVEKNNHQQKALCLLMIKGSFYGMGYIETSLKKMQLQQLQEILEPHADNNFIRNSMHNYVEHHPEKRVSFVLS